MKEKLTFHCRHPRELHLTIHHLPLYYFFIGVYHTGQVVTGLQNIPWVQERQK